MSHDNVIDLDALRQAARRRDGVEQTLAERQRRRVLERQVDDLERLLRDEAVAQEELRQTHVQAQRELEAIRAEAAHLQETVERARAKAAEVLQEFETVKQEILTLHEARETADRELGRLDRGVQRYAEEQRRLWRECRDSAEALSQLRRSLGGVLAEVRYVLSDRDGEEQ